MYGLLGSDNICLRYNYLKFWNLRVKKKWIEKTILRKSPLKLSKLSSMHITKQKLSFGIFTVLNIPSDFWNKRKRDHFDPYNVLLAIAANIPCYSWLLLCSRFTYLVSDLEHLSKCTTWTKKCKILSFIFMTKTYNWSRKSLMQILWNTSTITEH